MKLDLKYIYNYKISSANKNYKDDIAQRNSPLVYPYYISYIYGSTLIAGRPHTSTIKNIHTNTHTENFTWMKVRLPRTFDCTRCVHFLHILSWWHRSCWWSCHVGREHNHPATRMSLDWNKERKLQVHSFDKKPPLIRNLHPLKKKFLNINSLGKFQLGPF